MSKNRIWSGIRLAGHQLNVDATGCHCGAKPVGWDKSIPIRHWHGEHKLNVLREKERQEDKTA